ncbi:MAG: RNA polymerase factor sigma-54 [Bacteroidetes bacterium]|nr:RNA polymerase factor sigma-54 [Bacteroidota bacterium]
MLRLTQTQRMQQKLSPAQVQYLKILQLPVLQLEQKIKDELEMNPLLEEGQELEEDQEERLELEQEVASSEDETEEDQLPTKERDKIDGEREYLEREIRENSDDEYSWEEFFENNESAASSNQYWDGEDDYDAPLPASVSMREQLIDQLHLLDLTEEQELLANMIIWNIDDDGYLHTDFGELVRDYNLQHEVNLTFDEAEEVLRRIQRIDPPGIGSRNLRECLLVQLEQLPNTSTARIVAMRILRDAWESLEKKQFRRIQQELHISEEMLKKAYDIIVGLNPKPGEGDGIDSTNYIIPDFFITREDGEFVISLNERGVPPLRVNKAYKNMLLHQRKKLSRDTKQFLRDKMEAAKWFILSIHQRRNTMYAVMSTIIERQREWFEHGQGHLRPLIYKDIAEEIEMDISTISRVVNGKYAQTEWGVFELRYFFNEGIPTDSGEEIANMEVKSIIKEIIDGENPKRPFSDQELTKILMERGFNIARRTVAKYRESMDIPISRMRKQLV